MRRFSFTCARETVRDWRFAFALVALLGACAPGETAKVAVLGAPAGERIEKPGYTFVPPSEAGWQAGPAAPGDIALRKPGADADESTVQFVRLFRSERAMSVTGLIQELDSPYDAARFRAIRIDPSRPYRHRGASCASGHSVVEDLQAPTQRVAGKMLIEMYALLCIHPQDARVWLQIGYSHRYHPGQPDLKLRAQAMAAFERVDFTDLPAPGLGNR